MYKIGILQNVEHTIPAYIDELEQLGFTIEFILPSDLTTDLPSVDVYLIEESQSLKTCELILTLRKKSTRLIWVLSQQFSKINKLVYFELGADGVSDIVNEKEILIIQLSNILKRMKANTDDFFEEKDSSLLLIPNNLSVLKNGREEVSLTPLEFKILNLLVSKRGEMVPYKEIYQTLWNEEKKNQLYRVNNLIFSLRKKLKDPSDRFYIRTVRSKGYVLNN